MMKKNRYDICRMAGIFLAIFCAIMVFSTGVWAGTQRTVVLHNPDGTLTKISVQNGQQMTFPAVKNPAGYGFMGWSPEQGKTCAPEYEAGQQIYIRKNMHFYPVLYKWDKEPDLNVKHMAENVNGYSRIIFVGDSRTKILKHTLEVQGVDLEEERLGFVCKSGQGLSWFKEEGLSLLEEEINKAGDVQEREPVAIIFNLGINDLGFRKNNFLDCDKQLVSYLTYMNTLARNLSGQNCRLYYMSVNPVNSARKRKKDETQIRYFNENMKHGLDSSYFWIDTYSWLMQNGYSTHNDFFAGRDDGLHYSMRTSKRIYQYCMEVLKGL